MADAEPVIGAVLPDANVPTSIRSQNGVPVAHGSASDRANPRHWLAAHADGIACVIGRSHVPGEPSPRPVADPGAVEGARRSTLVVLIDPEASQRLSKERSTAMSR